MPHFANNHRQTLSVGVKFTLILFAAVLLFTGTTGIVSGEVSSPTGRVSHIEKDDTSEGGLATLIPSGGKFLTSLRFWEKPKSPSHTKSATVTNATPQTHKTVPKAETKNVPVEPTVQRHSVATGSVLEPPSDPYIEQRFGPLGDAPLPGQSANFAYKLSNGDGAIPQETKSGTASYASYSFDTRDWVESFPIHAEQNVAHGGIPGETQKTSLYLPEPSIQKHQSIESEDAWNGHATTLVAHIQSSPPQTVAPPPVTNIVTVDPPQVEVAQPQIDLTPSYRRRLQNVQTCGVVVVQSNFPLTEIASILDEINLLQHDLNRYIGVPEPKEKIELCLFKDEESYALFLKEFFPRAPTNRRALYIKLGDKPGTLLVQKTKDFEIDLRHEMTHAIIHASIPVVPIWLDEGLAKYFEVPYHHRAEKNPYMTEIRRNLRFGNIPSLTRLAKLETIDDMTAKEYRESWAWTHFLIHRSPETHQLLAAYLQMLASWTPNEPKPGHVLSELFVSALRDSERPAPVPSLKLYLDDIMPNQREAFKEHFGSH